MISVFFFLLIAMVVVMLTYHSIDLRSLRAQNASNVVMPPIARTSKYIILRFYDVEDDAEVC